MTNKLTSFVLAVLLAGCAGKKETAGEAISLPYYSQADFTPVWYEDQATLPDSIHRIAPFSFVNQDGNTVTEKDVAGKIYVANFFFTICPMVCPKMTDNLQRVQTAYEKDGDVLLLSHTVMPWVDSVATLKEYALERGIQSGKWHLLTGEKEALYGLGRDSYFADEGFGKEVTAETDFLHTENVVLIDRQGHIRGVYNGTLPLEMARLIEDIAKLKAEGPATAALVF